MPFNLHSFVHFAWLHIEAFFLHTPFPSYEARSQSRLQLCCASCPVVKTVTCWLYYKGIEPAPAHCCDRDTTADDYIRTPSIFKVAAGAVRPSAMCGCCRRCSWSWLDWLSHLQLFVPSTHIALFAFAKLQPPMIVWLLFADVSDVCCPADTVTKVCKKSSCSHDTACLQNSQLVPLVWGATSGLVLYAFVVSLRRWTMLTTVANGQSLVCFQSARMSGPKTLRNVWHHLDPPSICKHADAWDLWDCGLWPAGSGCGRS